MSTPHTSSTYGTAFDWRMLFDRQGLQHAQILMAAVRQVHEFRSKQAAAGHGLTETEVAEFASHLLDAAEECEAAMPSGQMPLLLGLLAIEAAGLKNNFDVRAEHEQED